MQEQSLMILNEIGEKKFVVSDEKNFSELLLKLVFLGVYESMYHLR